MNKTVPATQAPTLTNETTVNLNEYATMAKLSRAFVASAVAHVNLAEVEKYSYGRGVMRKYRIGDIERAVAAYDRHLNGPFNQPHGKAPTPATTPAQAPAPVAPPTAQTQSVKWVTEKSGDQQVLSPLEAFHEALRKVQAPYTDAPTADAPTAQVSNEDEARNAAIAKRWGFDTNNVSDTHISSTGAFKSPIVPGSIMPPPMSAPVQPTNNPPAYSQQHVPQVQPQAPLQTPVQQAPVQSEAVAALEVMRKLLGVPAEEPKPEVPDDLMKVANSLMTLTNLVTSLGESTLQQAKHIELLDERLGVLGDRFELLTKGISSMLKGTDTVLAKHKESIDDILELTRRHVNALNDVRVQLDNNLQATTQQNAAVLNHVRTAVKEAQEEVILGIQDFMTAPTSTVPCATPDSQTSEEDVAQDTQMQERVQEQAPEVEVATNVIQHPAAGEGVQRQTLRVSKKKNVVEESSKPKVVVLGLAARQETYVRRAMRNQLIDITYLHEDSVGSQKFINLVDECDHLFLAGYIHTGGKMGGKDWIDTVRRVGGKKFTDMNNRGVTTLCTELSKFLLSKQASA